LFLLAPLRLLRFPALLLAGTLLGLSHAVGAPWRLESSTPVPVRAGSAIAHQLAVVSGGVALKLHLIQFDRGRCALRVLDLPEGAAVSETVRAAGGLAGINGGYFTPDHSPLGLVVSQGAKLHPLETSKLLTGLLVVTARGASLVRIGEFRPGPALREALQAGPFLVDHGRPVDGLNATRAAERTVILADKQGAFALMITDPVSLADLGQILATPELFPGLNIERALNLDGGSSTALWVDAAPEPFSKPEWKQVRNAVAIMAR
jgi:hypothetical protein